MLASMRTADVKEELQRSKQIRNWTPQARPISVVEAAIEAKMEDRLWGRTDGCKKQWRGVESWCREYSALKVELASAREAVKAQSEVEKVREDFYNRERTTGDYQVEFWSKMTGESHVNVLIGLIILSVMLIEIGSAAGLTIAITLLASEDSHVKKAVRTVMPGQGQAETSAPSTPMQNVLLGPFARKNEQHNDDPRIIGKVSLKKKGY